MCLEIPSGEREREGGEDQGIFTYLNNYRIGR